MPAQPRTSVIDRLKATARQGMNNTVQYAKDVATGKKLWEGLKQNDGAVDGWIAHGANELATVFLTGHPAPVYTRSMSPPDQDEPPAMGAVESGPDHDAPSGGAAEIRSHQQAKTATHHEVTVNQNVGEDMQQTFFQSSLGHLMDRVRSLSPAKQPEKEICQ